MKTVQQFKPGDAIPDEAKFLTALAVQQPGALSMTLLLLYEVPLYRDGDKEEKWIPLV